MEGKNRQKGIVQNRISFERFVRLFAMIEIALAIYQKYYLGIKSIQILQFDPEDAIEICGIFEAKQKDNKEEELRDALGHFTNVFRS